MQLQHSRLLFSGGNLLSISLLIFRKTELNLAIIIFEETLFVKIILKTEIKRCIEKNEGD